MRRSKATRSGLRTRWRLCDAAEPSAKTRFPVWTPLFLMFLCLFLIDRFLKSSDLNGRVPVEQLKAAAAEEKESKEEFERAINSIRAQMEQVLTRSLFASSLFSVFVYSSIPTLIFIDHQIDYKKDILKLHRGLVYQKTRIMSGNLI